jgi:hypothetical protein
MRIALRRYLAALLLGLAVVPFAWAGIAPAKTTAPRSQQVGCGVERWAVKTLADPSARRVSLFPRPTTIRALRKKQVPGYLGLRRLRGVERTTYRVRASLVEMKLEDDSDIHLVIADPSNSRATMIAEFPAASCTAGASRTARRKMRRARKALVAACGSPSRSFKRLDGNATMSGVGFFDQIHGQTGVAPNGIELHPVVSFTGSTCRGSVGSAATSRWPPASAEWELPLLVSDGLHSTPTAGSELRGHPIPQLPSALGRGRSRSASLRR